MNLVNIGKGVFFSVLLSVCAQQAFAAPVSMEGNAAAPERTALELQVELNRLGSSGDPIERESILRKIVQQCPGTEEAEAAYWALSDLYLDAFSEPREAEARDVLELFLKKCPDSRWVAQAKCRLLALYGAKDQRAAELRRELARDKGLPQMLRSALKL